MTIPKTVLDGDLEVAAFCLTNGASIEDARSIVESNNSSIVREGYAGGSPVFGVLYASGERARDALENYGLKYDVLKEERAASVLSNNLRRVE